MKKRHPHPADSGHVTDENSKNSSVASSAAKRPYHAPRVTSHGPLVRIALGGTPGTGDSGLPTVQRPGP